MDESKAEEQWFAGAAEEATGEAPSADAVMQSAAYGVISQQVPKGLGLAESLAPPPCAYPRLACRWLNIAWPSRRLHRGHTGTRPCLICFWWVCWVCCRCRWLLCPPLPLLQVFTRAPFLKPMMDRVTSMVPSTEKLQYGAWGEFMMPADGYGRPTPMELRGKFMTNVGQFSGNYLSFGSGLSVLAIFFHPFLLFLGIGLFFGFRRAQSPEPMVLMGRTLSGAEKSTGMVAIAITTILVTGALGACGGGSGGSGGSSFSSCSCYCWWRRRKGRCWWLCCCCLLPLLRGGTGGEGDRCCHTPAASTDTRARCWRIVSGPWRTLFHIIIFQRRWSGSLDSSA